MLYKYSYDLSGRTLGISGSDGTSVNYVYDDFSRVSKQISKVHREDRGRFLVLT